MSEGRHTASQRFLLQDRQRFDELENLYHQPPDLFILLCEHVQGGEVACTVFNSRWACAAGLGECKIKAGGDGERADVIILTRAMMDDLAKQNKLAPGNIVNVASTPVALAARAGAPKPDISTADAFKQTLLSAKSISYADPSKGGLSGVVASRAIERLGIVEQMKPKTTLVPGAQSPELVAKGEVEFGIAQASEIVPNAGAQLVGPLPGELGSMTQFSGSIGAESASANASKALIDFLVGKEAGSHFKVKGFEPGG